MRGIWTAVAPFNQAAVSITGGQITGVSGVPYTLAKGGIPFISLSSGSVSAAGAISGITALPAAYPHAFCYFPANILATAIAAGWYYCTFSTTTAGTAFLNTYTSGVPTIPTSPTAVTDGKGAYTGDTGEEFGLTLTVPAGAMGANGALRIAIQYLQTNNANVKTGRVRFSGNAGTIFFADALASVGNSGFIGQISNISAAVQAWSSLFGTATGGSITPNIGNVDTSVATTLVFSLQKATATDNIIQYPAIVEVLG